MCRHCAVTASFSVPTDCWPHPAVRRHPATSKQLKRFYSWTVDLQSYIFIHYLITWTGSRADRLSVTCLLHLLGSRASPDGLLALSLQCISAVFRKTDADVAMKHACAGHDNVPGWLDAAMLLSLSCKLGAGNPSQASKAKQLGVSFACAINEKSLVEARYSSLAHVLQHAP